MRRLACCLVLPGPLLHIRAGAPAEPAEGASLSTFSPLMCPAGSKEMAQPPRLGFLLAPSADLNATNATQTCACLKIAPRVRLSPDLRAEGPERSSATPALVTFSMSGAASRCGLGHYGRGRRSYQGKPYSSFPPQHRRRLRQRRQRAVYSPRGEPAAAQAALRLPCSFPRLPKVALTPCLDIANPGVSRRLARLQLRRREIRVEAMEVLQGVVRRAPVWIVSIPTPPPWAPRSAPRPACAARGIPLRQSARPARPREPRAASWRRSLSLATSSGAHRPSLVSPRSSLHPRQFGQRNSVPTRCWGCKKPRDVRYVWSGSVRPPSAEAKHAGSPDLVAPGVDTPLVPPPPCAALTPAPASAAPRRRHLTRAAAAPAPVPPALRRLAAQIFPIPFGTRRDPSSPLPRRLPPLTPVSAPVIRSK